MAGCHELGEGDRPRRRRGMELDAAGAMEALQCARKIAGRDPLREERGAEIDQAQLPGRGAGQGAQDGGRLARERAADRWSAITSV